MSNRYPLQAVLRDGRRLLIRPFTENDVDALYEFFLRLPREVRRFAWDRIDNRSLVESWGRELEYSKVLPLLAFDGTKVVADATLQDRKSTRLNSSHRCISYAVFCLKKKKKKKKKKINQIKKHIIKEKYNNQAPIANVLHQYY